MQTLIEVTPRKQMGRIDCYPFNDLAKKFCDLLGTKILTMDNITKLRALGFQVEEKHEKTI